MIYYGLRSSPQYLELLHKVRAHPTPYDIISVIGGLAFLHAIGPECKSLIIVDTDPDAQQYAELCIRLIQKSDTCADFISFLSGHEVSSHWNVNKKLGKKISIHKKVEGLLQNEALFTLYQNTFGRIECDIETGMGKIDDSKIHFFDYSLTPMNFNWQFGAGIFKDEDSFQSLKTSLLNLSCEIRLQSLDDIDYGSDPIPPQDILFVLASNTDSPLFTKGDSILKRVKKTIKRETHYISWTRKLSILPTSESHKDLLHKLQKFTARHSLISVGNSPAIDHKEDLKCTEFTNLVTLAALEERKPYNFDTLIVWDDDTREEFLQSVCRLSAPLLHRIIFVSARSTEEILQACSDIKESYYVSQIEWAAEKTILVWDLRGAA